MEKMKKIFLTLFEQEFPNVKWEPQVTEYRLSLLEEAGKICGFNGYAFRSIGRYIALLTKNEDNDRFLEDSVEFLKKYPHFYDDFSDDL